MSITYSARAAQAIGFLKNSYNDIEIYVEDTANHSMWIKIVRAIIPAGRHIRSVNQLGGKDVVLKACSLDQKRRSGKRLYIIDGDFDALNGKRAPKMKHLYRIKAYCIENTIIHEAAVIDLAMALKPSLKEERISLLIDYSRFVDDTFGKLHSLFGLYAIARKFAPEIKTVSYSVSNLFHNIPDGVIISPEKTFSRMIALSREICEAIGFKKFRKEVNLIRPRLLRLNCHQTVSGKDYIIPIIYIMLKKRFGFREDYESLKVRLASQWSPSAEPGLARSILGIC